MLTKSGWIKTDYGSDGRMKYTKLNKKGRQVLNKILPHWKQKFTIEKDLIKYIYENN